MRIVRRILWFVLASFAIAAVVGGGLWWKRQRDHTFYTDAQSIRVPIGSTTTRDVLWEPALPVDGLVNSARHEAGPTISSDGMTMILVRGAPGGGADLYATQRTVHGWTEPTPINGVNTRFDEISPAMSADGQSLFFASDRPGGLGGYDLWVARREGDGGWGEPMHIGPAVNTRWNEYGPAPTSDGMAMYFASNRPRAVDPTAPLVEGDPRARGGDYNLFVASLLADGPGAAHAVDAVNTDANETSPALSPSGDFLYFASDRAGGFGGFDLYRSRVVRGAVLPARNLGAAINTFRDELDPAVDFGGFALFFASARPRPRIAAGSVAETDLDSDLHRALSREVFTETDPFAARIDWAGLWSELWPLLLLALLGLLLVLALLHFMRRAQFRRLSLLAKCLLTSLLAHLLIMLLLTVWGVTSTIAQRMKDGSVRVAITSNSAAESVANQIRGGLTDVSIDAEQPTEGGERPSESPLLQPMPMLSATAAIEPRRPATDASQVPPATREAPTTEVIERFVTHAEAPPALTDAPTALPMQPERAHHEERRVEVAAGDVAMSPATDRAETRAPAVETADPTTAAMEPAPAQRRDGATSTSLAGQHSPREAAPIEEAAREATLAADLPRIMDAAVALPREVRGEPSRISEPTTRIAAESTTASQRAGEVTATKPAVPPPSSEVVAVAPASNRREGDSSAIVGDAASREADAPEASRPPATGAASDVPRTGMEIAVALPVAQPAPEGALAAETTVVAAPQHIASRRAPEDGVGDNPPTAEATIVATDAASAERAATGSLARADESESASTRPESSPRRDVASSLLDLPALATALPGLDEAAIEPAANGELSAGPSITPEQAATRRAASAWSRIAGPAAPRATRIDPSDRRVPAPESSFATDGAMATGDAASSDAVSMPPVLALVVADLPGIDRIMNDLRLPSERPPVDNPLSQRGADRRESLLDRLGGNQETENAVQLALRWLAAHQSDDGRWSASGFDAKCEQCGGQSNARIDAALTGLAVLAFLGADHTHEREGPYRDTVARALRWLVDRQAPDGGFLSEETMYTQGIVTIALTEAFAMTGDPWLESPARRATDFVVQARNRELGGWRYAPGQFGDTSVTGWQVMALASARRARIDVPAEALTHVHRWMDAVRHPTLPGRYAYQPGRQYTNAMTAEGMFIRQLLGAHREERAQAGSALFLLENLPDWENAPDTYYWYYGTLAMFHHQGPEWDRWNAALKNALLSSQHRSGPATGSWDPNDQWSQIGGRVYQTAIAALCLEVYYRYDPLTNPDEAIDAVGTIRGVVTSRSDGKPLPGAVVTLDIPGREALQVRTDGQGRYALQSPEMPEHFALSAARPGFAPLSMTAQGEALRGQVLERDFALEPLTSDIIALEQVPEVHHLGNDRFEGSINSQFQRAAEGAVYSVVFRVGPEQLPPNYRRAELRMLVKGAQAGNRIRLNGRVLPTRLNRSPRDGSYGEFVAPFDIRLLFEGENELVIQSSDDMGDLDDFEFVNVQIRLFNE